LDESVTLVKGLKSLWTKAGKRQLWQNFVNPIIEILVLERVCFVAENCQKSQKIFPGVDVMITIFGDFWQFSAKKLAFFSKTNVMIKILHILALFCVKNANIFAKFFGKNIQKITTLVPGHVYLYISLNRSEYVHVLPSSSVHHLCIEFVGMFRRW
jgi:hypothetical protein